MADRNDLNTMLAAAGFVVLPLAVYSLRQRQADWPLLTLCGIIMILAAEVVAITSVFRKDDGSSGVPFRKMPFALVATPQGLLFILGLALMALGSR